MMTLFFDTRYYVPPSEMHIVPIAWMFVVLLMYIMRLIQNRISLYLMVVVIITITVRTNATVVGPYYVVLWMIPTCPIVIPSHQ